MNLNDYLKNRITRKQRNKNKHIFNPNLSSTNKFLSVNTSSYADNNQNKKINKSYIDYKSNEKINSEIIKSYNYNTIEVPKTNKINNFNFYNINNPNKINLTNYVKNSKINKNIKNEKIRLVVNDNNKNYNIRNDVFDLKDEVEYMNMKINLKVLEHKLSKLTDVLISDDIFIPKHRYENIINFGNIINARNIYTNINDKNININEKDLRLYNKNIENNDEEEKDKYLSVEKNILSKSRKKNNNNDEINNYRNILKINHIQNNKFNI